jgi:hypothetical protein
MSFPVTLAVTLSVPPDEGLAPADIPFNLTANVTQRSEQVLVLTGSGTKTVDFGTIGTGLKVAVIEVVTGTGAAPVMCRWNGGGSVGAVEISPGGCMAVGSPNPTSDGLTALELVYTANSTVKLWLYG